MFCPSPHKLAKNRATKEWRNSSRAISSYPPAGDSACSAHVCAYFVYPVLFVSCLCTVFFLPLCSLLFVMISGDRWHKLNPCARWLAYVIMIFFTFLSPKEKKKKTRPGRCLFNTVLLYYAARGGRAKFCPCDGNAKSSGELTRVCFWGSVAKVLLYRYSSVLLLLLLCTSHGSGTSTPCNVFALLYIAMIVLVYDEFWGGVFRSSV